MKTSTDRASDVQFGPDSHLDQSAEAWQNTVTRKLTRARRERAKYSFNTRRVPIAKSRFLISGDVQPVAGDLVLARVDAIGQHGRLHMVDGRRAALYPGDEIAVCYGNRYAAHQFEATVPSHLSPCQLVAAGGIASVARSRHSGIKAATAITPIGLLADKHQRVLNVRDFALPTKRIPSDKFAPVIAVVGTEMNAGKTTTVASIINSASQWPDMVVSACKATGTGSAGDCWAMSDAGAGTVYDFLDAGYSSTYQLDKDTVVQIFETLIGNLLDQDSPDIIVVEVADSMMQQESAVLLRDTVFRQQVDGIVLAASDPIAAVGGVSLLKQAGLPVVGVSGVVAASELGRQAVVDATGVPTYDTETLRRPGTLPLLVPELRRLLSQQSDNPQSL